MGTAVTDDASADALGNVFAEEIGAIHTKPMDAASACQSFAEGGGDGGAKGTRSLAGLAQQDGVGHAPW